MRVWDWDLLTDRVAWDEPADGKFGYHRSGRSASAAWWYERLHADDRERVVSGIHAAIANGAASWSRRVSLPPRGRQLRACAATARPSCATRPATRRA